MQRSPIGYRIATLLLLVAGSSAFGDGVTIAPRGGAQPPAVYQRSEWDVQLDRTYDNPFDPEQIAIDATFTGPAGQVLVVPGFWCEVPKRTGFIVRFTPPVAGRWTCTVAAKDKAGTRTSDKASFDVAPSPNVRGFVRRTADNPRYFQFDSGHPFFILGLNIAWSGDRGLDAYERWFTKLSSNGGNFARIWMTHPGRMTETVEAGVGRYDQDACAFYDAVLELAERHGIYCMVTFNNHRDLLVTDMWGDATWPRFPYNAANGGPATRPSDFISDPRCQQLYRQRLRYVAARYGAYTSVAFWELWNEQHYAKVSIPPAWTRQMAQYLKSVDPYKHLVTTSFGSLPQPAVWEMPEIDLTQDHLYPNDESTDAAAPISMSSYAHAAYDKPHLVGEFGISAYGSDVTKDERGIGTNMHNGVWAGMMSGAAGGGAIWWWDNYVDRHDLWHTFRGASAFARTIEWNRRRFEPIAPPAPLRLDAGAAPETFFDVVIPAVGMWGRSHGQRVQVLPNGQSLQTLSKYLYAPAKRELRTPTSLSIDVPAGGATLVIRVAKVSDFGVLRVSIDDDPKADFAFSALPGSPDVTTTERLKEGEPGKPLIYQAVINKDCELPLPGGRHEIALDNVAGDWMMIDCVTIRGGKSSRYADLRVLALHDAASGQTLAWVQDPASNWRNDVDGVTPRTIPGAALSLPVAATDAVDYDVEWWDTRAGTVASRDRVKAAAGHLNVRVPPFTRDVAMRATPAAASAAK